MLLSSNHCLAPLETAQTIAFVVPKGACDCHAHVVSEKNTYPFVANRSYTPPHATETQYFHMLNRNGITRGVLVQISVYGTDNRYMLEVLERNPERLRGIAVIDEHISDHQLNAMHKAGVRGVRINVLFGGGIGFDSMERLASRIAELGWHMQFLMDITTLPELLPRMKKLPCIGVIDHMGHTPVAQGPQSQAFQTLQHMVRDHGWWVKLSGAYRINGEDPDYSQVTPWAQALINTAPDQMVWGSDWPHVAIDPMVDTGYMLNLLAAWAPDEATRHKILVENPARLYDFPMINA